MQGMAVHFSKKKNATIDANCSSVDAADYFYTFVWCGYWSSIRQQHKQLQAAAVVTKRRGCAGFEALALLFFFTGCAKIFFLNYQNIFRLPKILKQKVVGRFSRDCNSQSTHH